MSTKMNEAICKFGIKRSGALERLYFWMMMLISSLGGVALTLMMLSGQSIVDQAKMQEVYDNSLIEIRAEAEARVREANEKFEAIINRLPPGVVTSAVRGAKFNVKP